MRLNVKLYQDGDIVGSIAQRCWSPTYVLNSFFSTSPRRLLSEQRGQFVGGMAGLNRRTQPVSLAVEALVDDTHCCDSRHVVQAPNIARRPGDDAQKD